MLPNDSSALIGRTIAGKFVVESVIAVGGIGTVYRARQLALDRIVAIKVLHDEIARQEKFIERFKREARAASRLDHPNSVRVLDFGQEGDSLLYLAMEYVQGSTLYEVIQKDWPFDDRRIVDILSQVLAAVGVAHDMGVIHRDLKPENIIIIRGRSDEGDSAELAKVCDFGIATLGTPVSESGGERTEGPRVTSRGFIIGTPEYMSPEQVMGEEADQRSDIYAMGVILYQLLAGRVPFEGQTPYAVAVKHVAESPLPPSSFASVNPALEAICLTAMSKDPDGRFANAREMRTALRAVVGSTTMAVAVAVPSTEIPALAPRLSDPAPAASYSAVSATTLIRRRRLSLFGGMALACALILAFAITTRFRSYRASRVAVPGLLPTTRPQPLPAPLATATPTAAPATIAAPETHPAEERRESSLAHREASATAPAAQKWTRTARVRPIGPRGGSRPHRTTEPLETEGVVASPPVASSPIKGTEAPSQAPTTTPTPPAPAVTVPVARPTVDIAHANVSIVGVATTSGVAGSQIRAVISRIPILGCYRDALRSRGAPATGTATLHLAIDVGGYVTAASLQGALFLPAMKGCVERAVRAARVKDVDTGEASVDVTLNFVSTP
jgi:predicted Ser/Thr protein kinase